MTDWSAEQVTEVERLWKDGQSGGEIAKAFGKSRCSVLGLIHRRGIVRPAKPRPQPKPARARLVKAVTLPAIRLEPVVLSTPVVPSTTSAGSRRPILEAKRNRCRFPLWHDQARPRSDEAFVCGAPVMKADDLGARGSYCSACYARTIARVAA